MFFASALTEASQKEKLITTLNLTLLGNKVKSPIRHILLTSGLLIGCAAYGQSFEGFYAQGGLTYDSLSPSSENLVVKITSGGGAGTYSGTGNPQSKSGYGYDLGVGYGFRMGEKSILSVGMDFNPIPISFTSLPTATGLTFTTSGSTAKNRIQWYVAPGYELDSESLIYAKLGQSRANWKNNDGSGDTAKLTGTLFGVGYKKFFDKNLYGYGEVNTTNFSKQSVAGSGITYTGTYSYTVGASLTNFTIGVGYKF